MKVILNIDNEIEEDTILINAKELSEEISQIYNNFLSASLEDNQLLLYKDNYEYLIKIKDIIFFETEGQNVYAHTSNDYFQCRLRLYELEERLPLNFLRISKSTIINVKQVYSLERKLSSASLVAFRNSHKEVYVSRRYYNVLKDKLNERSGL